MFSTKFSTFAAIACISLAVIPGTRGVIIPVTVGGPNGTIAYNPTSVTANVGDVVVFTFMQKNHTITQSSLATPCSPLANGFDSGFVPVSADQTSDFPQAQLTVKDTNPIWVYCRQTGHCQQGMVFAVNPGDKLAAFQAAATGGSTSASTSAAAPPSSTSAGSSAPSAPPTSSSTDHLVVVGGTAGNVFTPSNITAQPGDTVTFQFHSKNHTATQSTFANPCRALGLTSTTGQVGFDSGFMAVDASATSFPTFTIQINDTQPIWTYCRQTGHCGSGMVFSVNAVEPNSFAAFQAKAIQLNGTASASGSGSAASPSNTNGATSSLNPVRSAAGTIAFVGLVLGLVL